MVHDDGGEVIEVVALRRAARVGHVGEHEVRHVQRAQRKRDTRVYLGPGTKWDTSYILLPYTHSSLEPPNNRSMHGCHKNGALRSGPVRSKRADNEWCPSSPARGSPADEAVKS